MLVLILNMWVLTLIKQDLVLLLQIHSILLWILLEMLLDLLIFPIVLSIHFETIRIIEHILMVIVEIISPERVSTAIVFIFHEDSLLIIFSIFLSDRHIDIFKELFHPLDLW